MNQHLKYQAPKGSEEFKLLSIISGLHVTARQKNIQLLKVCGSKGVAFKDIRNHLMNEAKRCGLWESGRREQEVVKRAWYVAATNFVIWCKKNYTDYNIEKIKPSAPTVQPISDKPREVIVRREFTKAPKEVQPAGPEKKPIIITTPDPKKVLADKIENDKKVVEAAKKAASTKKETTPPPEPAIFKSVEESLTAVQIQTLIFRNLEILGQKAVELGAGPEWNSLMVAMGLDDEVIEIDEFDGQDPFTPEVTEFFEESAVQ